MNPRKNDADRTDWAFHGSGSTVRVPLGAFANLMVWLLIGLFAVMCLFCVVAGAEVYRGSVRNADVNANLRTAVSYVSGKVRAWDCQGSISVMPWGDGDSLMFTETIDDIRYTTCIYSWNGAIYELFAPSDNDFTPEDGQHIANGEGLMLEFQSPNLLEIRICISGVEYTSHVALRSDPVQFIGG